MNENKNRTRQVRELLDEVKALKQSLAERDKRIAELELELGMANIEVDQMEHKIDELKADDEL